MISSVQQTEKTEAQLLTLMLTRLILGSCQMQVLIQKVLGWGWGVCICNKLSDNAEAAGLHITLRNVGLIHASPIIHGMFLCF